MLGRGLARIFAFAGVLGALFVLLACEEENTYVPPPLPKVTVATPLIEEVTEYLEFTGTTAPYAQVEVSARVPGILTGMHFEPGTPVNAGDLLFTIDPVEYEALVKAAEAELAQAEARQTEAAKSLERSESLIQRGNISQAKLDEAQANFLSAKAEVLIRKANLTSAKIDLGYTEVTAPISGRVGRNLVDVGNLVGQGETTLLTDITTYDPIYVYFDLNERDLLRVMSMNLDKGDDEGRAGKRKSRLLELGLANETGYPHKGFSDFAESQVDPETGTLRVRGVFDNPGQQPSLIPGLFVRIRAPIAERPDMPLVAERAIAFDQSGRYVLVVNADNVVEKRPVVLGPTVEGLMAIESGVVAGERIVVNGLQRAREGIEVETEEVDMADLSASATGVDAESPGGPAGDTASEGSEETDGAEPAPDPASQ